MDSSSRKIVTLVGILTIVILAVMAGNFYADSGAAESTAAIEPPAPLNDSAEAVISQGTAPSASSEFSTDVPQSEDVPAIDGAPSMVLDGADNKGSTPVAPESVKGTEGTAVIVE